MKEERDKVRREKLASFFYDSAKLMLGGLVIGGVSPIFTDDRNDINIYMILAGGVATYVLAKIANDILK